MAKTSKKEAKEETPKKVKVETAVKCEACKGSGLVRPTFRNSPLCEVCKGLGVN